MAKRDKAADAPAQDHSKKEKKNKTKKDTDDGVATTAIAPASAAIPLLASPAQLDPKLAALFANAVPAELPKPVIKPVASVKSAVERPKDVTGEKEKNKKRKAAENESERQPVETSKKARKEEKPHQQKDKFQSKKDSKSEIPGPGEGKKKKKERHRNRKPAEDVAAPAPAPAPAPALQPSTDKPAEASAPTTETSPEPTSSPKSLKTIITFETTTSPDSDSDEPEPEPNQQPSSTNPSSKDKQPYNPRDDPKLSRTIFLGNLTTTVTTSKPLLKQFKALLRQFGTLESIRFRSVAFTAPIPKRAAFLSKQLHPQRDSLHAYAVFATDEAAKKAAKELNGTVFQEKHLRADMAGARGRDHSKSVFVGNLPFDISDESLWQHFADAGEITSVRVIRDPVTQMGKGFAYVAFAEKSAASLALDLDGSELRKRKIRVTKSVGKPKSVKKREKGKKNAVQTPAQRRIAGKRDAQKAKKPGKFEGVHAKPGDAKGMLKQKGSGKPKIKKQTKKVARGKKSAGTKA